MIKYIKNWKKYKIAGLYIGSGLLKTASQILSGFIVLRWLEPEAIGMWQSFTVFVSYLQILTLGVTSGLNRELPYLLGKGDVEIGMNKLRSAGYFTTGLSLTLMVIIILVSIILFYLNIFSFTQSLIMISAFSIGALTIQTNFLGATYRSSQSFNKLSSIQFLNSILYFLLIPLVFFFELWGYICYQLILSLSLFIGYKYFRPYKDLKYQFRFIDFKDLVRIGLPMYFWNYIAELTRSIPRVILVLFGTPLLVGYFAPATAINSAMLNLPAYINRYIFPKMSFKFGKNNNITEIYDYTIRAAIYLFLAMLFCGVILAFIIPIVFPVFFPKYTYGILAAQIIIFSGVFYSVNALLHNALNSLKEFKPFKYIVSLRVLYIITFTFFSFYLFDDLLLSVAIGSVIAEFFNMINYIFFLKKIRR